MKRSKKTATSIRLINVQRRKNSCGPTAIANTLKWLGYKTTHDYMVSFCEGHRSYEPEIGMYPSQMRFILRVLKVKNKTLKHIKTRHLDKAIDEGLGVILLYRTKRGGHHAVFIDSRTDEAYRVWNRQSKKTRGPWCSRKFISNAIKRSLRHDRHCLAFLITPGQ